MNRIIHCIGDSHASFFSGRNTIQPAWPETANDTIPSFRSYRLGAVLAYNLSEKNTTSGGGEKLISLLEKLPKHSTILMSFGEIDCRVHLVKQSIKQNRNLQEIANENAERYFSVIKKIKTDFNVIVWATIPSTASEITLDHRYPVCGTNLERNTVTQLFNEKLSELCAQEGITFISIFKKLTKPDGSTNSTFYIDGVHLSQRAMPIAIEAISRQAPNMELQLLNFGLGQLPLKYQIPLLKIKSEISILFYHLNKKARATAKMLLQR